jgi:hypothetical protein
MPFPTAMADFIVFGFLEFDAFERDLRQADWVF